MIQTLIILFSFPIFLSTESGQIQLTIKNIESQQGSVLIAVYDNKDDFEKQGKEVYGEVISTLSSDQLVLTLPNLSFGTYAIAIYHDKNNNRKLDKNRFGIPKEPYAFSNNPKAKWSPATFEESKFDLDHEKKLLSIELKAWSKY